MLRWTKTTEIYMCPRENIGGCLLASQSSWPVHSHLDRAGGCSRAPSGPMGWSPALTLPGEREMEPGRVKKVQHRSG